jgi:ribosomal protein L1
MDDDQFNMNIRRYLKKVGITSQREIENAVRQALEKGELQGDEVLDMKVTLNISGLNKSVDIKGEISLT